MAFNIDELNIGQHYIVDTYSSGGQTEVFGKLSSKQPNVFGTNHHMLVFVDCIVNNEMLEYFKVTKPVIIFSHTIREITPIESNAENLIYALSRSLESMNEYLDPETVNELAQHLEPKAEHHGFNVTEPLRLARNIDGDPDGSSSDGSYSDGSNSDGSNSDGSNSDGSLDGGNRKNKSRKNKSRKNKSRKNKSRRKNKKG